MLEMQAKMQLTATDYARLRNHHSVNTIEGRYHGLPQPGLKLRQCGGKTYGGVQLQVGTVIKSMQVNVSGKPVCPSIVNNVCWFKKAIVIGTTWEIMYLRESWESRARRTCHGRRSH